ncbi:MAG: pyridoxamine 5'-phosphate oxidase family protein [Calditrichaeota bacterium]|nr:MAG: pyridoxamine 5'-phosphate oxidase family protein [Calditrichota bacterium]MBL1206581.1 pyridoxamine 5'-phosphate oxidase family protein [Calditrichota bacterium]NOG46408.1 pyridoxamine 5'-phosphate oxidase family protein [Calditrichota bacterium]
MGQRYSEISPKIKKFIESQKMFFVGTATAESRVNISPKGMDSFRVLDENRVVWLNVTGSGNETSAHVQENPRMTIMFCAYEGKPLILRLYGVAKAIRPNDPEWEKLYSLFNPLPGARQIFDVKIDLVQTSCGMAVPFYDYVEDRDLLTKWANKKSPADIEKYQQEKNKISLDGKPIHI